MTQPPNNLMKHWIEAGKPVQGAWSLSGSPTVVEALAHCGPDYLVLDLEHSPTAIHSALPLLQAAAGAEIPVAVRMADHNPTAIKQILDLGGETLLFPFVESAAEAEAIVRACLYPPLGHRGFSRMNRAGRYLADADYPRDANSRLLIIAQLETPDAIGALEQIAAVDGIGGVFLGPGDLSMSLEVPGELNHPRVRELMVECAAKARACGIACGTVMPSPEQAAWAFEQGYGFVSVSNDLALMVNAARAQQGDLRRLRAAAGIEASP